MQTKYRYINDIKIEEFAIIKSTFGPIFIPTSDPKGIEKLSGGTLKFNPIQDTPMYYLYRCDNCLDIVTEREELKDGEKKLCRNCYDSLSYTSKW